MKCRETVHSEREMSTAIQAQGYVKLMIEREARGWGDQTNALSRIEHRYGLSFWSLNNLRTGRAKTVEAGLFQRIRSAYVDMCERQITALAHEVAMERARDASAVDQDLAVEIENLAARVRAAQTKRGR